MIKIVKQLPNLMTICNLLFGCIAIVQVFSGRTHIACLLIFAAAVMDFLDGFVARVLNAQSSIGKELDSLADAVTFGVVPGMILFQLLALDFEHKPNAFEISTVFFYPAFIVTAFAILRLAIFNTTENKPDRFKGMPTPAMALFVACLALIPYYGNNPKLSNYILNSNYILGTIVVLSYLMVSGIEMFKLSPKAMLGKQFMMRWILIGISIIAIIVLKWAAALVILPTYLICSKIEFSFLNKN